MPYPKIHQHRISLVAGTILIAVTLLVGITVFMVMQRHAEDLLSKNLQSFLQNRGQLIQTEIGAGFDKAMLIATRPVLIDQMQRMSTGTDQGTARITLNTAIQAFLPTGLTAIALFDKGGRELAHAGSFAQKSELTVPLNFPGHVQLMWDGQLLLHAEADMKQAGQVVGKVMTETTLPGTTGALKDASYLGKTGELALCASLDTNMQCFPTALNPKIFTLSKRSPQGESLPMTHALEGDTGFIVTHDYRNQEVAAAYAPVGDLGLGMVLKMDSAELYAPVWSQLRYLIPLLVGVLVIALLLLRWLLTPLVFRLVRSEAQAREMSASLRDSERHERALLDNVDEGMLSISDSGIVEVFNPAAERMFGYRSEEVLGKNVSMLMPQPYRSEHDGYLGRYLHTGQAKIIGVGRVVTGRRSDGGVFPMELRVSEFYPVSDLAHLEGRRHFVGIIRDITERKQADLALASTNRALQMISRSGMAINRTDDDEASLLAEVCRLAVEMGGYRMAWVGYAQDDEARSIQPMTHAGDERGYLHSIEISWREDHATGRGPAGQAIRSGQPQQNGDISLAEDYYWRDAALQRGYRSAICLPLRDGPRSFGVLCLYAGEVQLFPTDEVNLLQEFADNLAFGIISLRARLERRRTQEVARQVAVKLREQASLLDRAQDAIMVRNLDRTFRYWNKGAERLYGWTAEEVLGKTMDDVMYRSPQVLIRAMNQILASDGDWTGELEQVARDGSMVYVDVRATMVRDEQGQINGVLGINTDIRERKRARDEILLLNASLEERVLQRTSQLEFANEQLEAFSSSVSHDLRSPLNAIDGFSSLLERTVVKMESGPLTERSAHYLARIRAGVSQMGELIDALLSLAQVSRASLLWETVDIGAMAGALLSRYQERESGRATQLQVEAGLLAQGDPRLLKQVLDNLLGNAWKFSAGQARTEITLGHETSSAGQTVYFVRDNGAGFDMAYADKLFATFQRLHTQDEFSGTGIGLATVQRIIARHGGKIWGESAPGCGATFYFTLGTAAP